MAQVFKYYFKEHSYKWHAHPLCKIHLIKFASLFKAPAAAAAAEAAPQKEEKKKEESEAESDDDMGFGKIFIVKTL